MSICAASLFHDEQQYFGDEQSSITDRLQYIRCEQSRISEELQYIEQSMVDDGRVAVYQWRTVEDHWRAVVY